MIKPSQSKPKPPRKAPEPPKKEPKAGLFGKRGYLTRPKLRKGFERASPKIPGTSRKFIQRERVKMEKELFPYKRYKSIVTQKEVRDRVRELQREKFSTKDWGKRQKIDDRIKWLKQATGL